MKLRGGFKDHKVTAQDMRLPAPTITASGTHLADVQAFLEKYSGSDEARGLVTINGERYIITDIGMRMLEPRELYRAQGFPDSYIINIMYKGKPLTKTAQVRMCGNSVCPQVGAALVWANVGMTMATQEIRARMMAATASN
jgi:DNA (cytosine-5)-methyltransferase 1